MLIPNRRLAKVAILTVAVLMGLCGRVTAEQPRSRVRMLLGGEYWSLETVQKHQSYLDYLAQVRPDVIHAGVLGPQMASTVYSRGKLRAYSSGVFPTDVATIGEYLAWWRVSLRKVHAHGVKVQAISSMTSAWGDHENNTGFFKYYNDLWEEDLLGPKPHPHALGLMQHNARGEVIRHSDKSGLFRYMGCVNNPYWRQLLKVLVRAGVRTGFDGFMVQFPYSDGPCGSQFCQAKFHAFLRRKYSAEALARKFAIDDLDDDVFDFTGPAEGIPGHLLLEAKEFGAVSVKDCFDEVFVRYGRSLKPDLIVSMWTHFRQFLVETSDNTSFDGFVEERKLLPVELWGKDEDYTWHCSPATSSRLKDGIVGDQTLEWKYCRAMVGPAPSLIQKYDRVRWRLTAGEAFANGGVVFGIWPGTGSGNDDREPVHLLSYFNFIRAADEYLFPRESYAEGAILYPRTALYSGDATFCEPVRRLGRALIDGHLLFDLLIDEKMSLEALRRYRFILIPTTKTSYLSSKQQQMLDAYMVAGGTVLVLPTGPPPKGDEPPVTDSRGRRIYWGDLKDKQALVKAVRKATGGALSKFDAPWTLQVHADRQPDRRRLLLHFVNYNRNEEDRAKEAPISADPVGVDLRLPPGLQVTGVRFLTPEVRGEQTVEFSQSKDRLRFQTPGLLVYGLAVIAYE